MNFASALSILLASSSPISKSNASCEVHRSKCSASSAARGCLAMRSIRPSASEWLVSMESTLSTQASSRACSSGLRMSLAGTQNGSGRWRCMTEGLLSTGGSYRSRSSRTSPMKPSGCSFAFPSDLLAREAAAGRGGLSALALPSGLLAREAAAGRGGRSAQESSSSSARPEAGTFGSRRQSFVAGRRTPGQSAHVSSSSAEAALLVRGSGLQDPSTQ
mmetsp:Transcript_114478/g.356527  ORF Transcript_114478/g.356527 Transcript_114478/m.356527 type:complete len:218 (-) Transcript_114478:233-886(-)